MFISTSTSYTLYVSTYYTIDPHTVSILTPYTTDSDDVYICPLYSITLFCSIIISTSDVLTLPSILYTTTISCTTVYLTSRYSSSI